MGTMAIYWKYMIYDRYPLVNIQKAIENGPFIVDLPIDSMVMFHSYVNVLPEGLG